MKTIGYIVVIALIVYVAIKFTKKKKEVADADPEGSPQTAATLLQELVDKPIEVIQERLSQIQQAAHEEAVKLNEKVPLVNKIPDVEKIIIIEQKPIVPEATRFNSPMKTILQPDQTLSNPRLYE